MAKSRLLKVVHRQHLEQRRNGDNIDLDLVCDLLRFSRVLGVRLPSNASSRQLVQPPGQAKLPHRRIDRE